MLKKMILAIATFAIIGIAFMIYQSREVPAPVPVEPPPVDEPLTTRPAYERSRQPVTRIEDRQTKTLDINKIPPGEAARIHVFDERTGDTKYVFQADRWEPIGASGTEFAVTEPNAEVVLPRGQKAYVRADFGHVVVARGAKGNNFEPKRGWFKGNVRIIVDRSTPQWRKANPDLADPTRHPEAIVKLWLEDVRFDLEMAQLFSDGPIRMQSADGTLEGRGLELVWNEVNRRITKLRVIDGRQATLRSSSLLDFGVSGASPAGKTRKAASAAATQPAASKAVTTTAPAKSAAPLALVPVGQTRSNAPLLVDIHSRPDRLRENRVDVYNIVFRDNIVAEQRDGIKQVGRLKAALIEILFEVGQTEREAAQHVSGTQPADEPAKPATPATAPAGDRSPLEAGSTVTITWTGELLITPATPDETPEQQKTGTADRLHLTATGCPVELYSRQTGQATCDKLEYHHETKQAWLTGTPDAPVRMASGPEGQIIGEKVFFDGKTGEARVDGPGRMITTRDIRGGEPEPTLGIARGRKRQAGTPAEQAKASTEPSPRALAWQKSALIHFDIATVPGEDAITHQVTARKAEYLKDATFDGDVTLDEPGQSMAAEHIEIYFRKPESADQSSREKAVVDRFTAHGRVRLASKDNHIACDSLDVEMTVDDRGGNVPRTGRAAGNVVARQGRAEIRAREEMLVTLASVLRPYTPEERKRIETVAKELQKERHFTPDSPEWKAFEARHRGVVTTVITALTARGDVIVHDPNPKEKLDVAADSLDCTFSEQQDITKATFVGRGDSPAHVDTDDFYIRGRRIHMDRLTQSAEVPGGGLLRFYTSQDLDGRPVDKPIPIVVTWAEHMSLDGQSNVGRFDGSVKAASENSTLKCKTLTLEFQNQPKPVAKPEDARQSWVRQLFTAAAGRRSRPGITAGRVAGSLGKRLAHLQAVGGADPGADNAAIELKAYDEAQPKTIFVRALAAIVPERLQAPVKSGRRKLASWASVVGPRIAVDLIEQNLIVQGKGGLLLCDYRVPERRPAGAGQRTGTPLSSLSEGSLMNYSPGQTAFTWRNGMSFFNQKNIAVFDRSVEMRHQSGSEMQMSPELAAATGLDTQALKALKGRRVRMSSDHLVVEFDREPGRQQQRNIESGTLSRATRLKTFTAAGRVSMEEGGVSDEEPETASAGSPARRPHRYVRSLDAAEVTYRDDTGLMRAIGTAKSPPQALQVDEETGTQQGMWRGKLLEWNVKTGRIRIRESMIIAPGR